MQTPASSYRVLVVDDNRAIHDDFRKILLPRETSAQLIAAEAALFGTVIEEPTVPTGPGIQLDSAYQGEEALEMVRRAIGKNLPYAMAFMDVRMPPGWDGIETIAQIWSVDPSIQIVICTAYTDYSLDDMIRKLGRSDRLLILKKPFDSIEAIQLVTALTEKWNLTRQARRHLNELEETVGYRTEQLRKNEDRYRLIAENAGDLIGLVDAAGRWLYRSPSFHRLLGHSPDALDALGLVDLIHLDDQITATAALRDCQQRGTTLTCEFRIRHQDGGWLTMEAHTSPFRNDTGIVEGTLFVTRDITERRKLEIQLRQSQKLESIGQLAAGIAHEINTPMQFIGDNMRFLNESFADLDPLLKIYGELLAAAEAGPVPPALLAAARAAHTTVSPDYLRDDIPKAIRDTLDGVKRTTKIVQAMKTFSHPGSSEKTPVNLRDAIESTLTISHGEWRHVAEVVTGFDPTMPAIPLLAGEFNQVLLNLIINAAHAIADVVNPADGKLGVITVTTRRDKDWAEVRVRDTGTGIPEKVQGRIFDPFFTTKPIGKGTGQGLPIARSVIVDQHRGTLAFETVPGQGTVFIIRVPIPPDALTNPPFAF